MSLSIIIPANDEGPLIAACLSALAGSSGEIDAEVIVVANGCTDDTVAVAESCRAAIEARGWRFGVIDLPEGGKPGALNAGDAAARFAARAYVDADVTVSPPLLAQVVAALDVPEPRYVSGRLTISEPESWVTRAYRRLYRRLPFIAEGVPGAGFFAVNAAGRARWGEFPHIISDDTFVRLSFAPQERHRVEAPYDWPLVEGWSNLVRVRRRQNIGVAEVYERFPDLERNADAPGVGKAGALGLFLREPLGFMVYGGVALATKFGGSAGWSRGR